MERRALERVERLLVACIALGLLACILLGAVLGVVLYSGIERQARIRALDREVQRYIRWCIHLSAKTDTPLPGDEGDDDEQRPPE